MSAKPVEKPRRKPMRHWKAVRWVFLLGGLGLLVYLIRQVGLRSLVDHATRLGWTFLLILAVYAGLHVLRTLSWKVCLGDDSSKLSLGSGISVWLAGESISHLSFGWSGDAFRATVLSPRISIARGLSALLVARMAYLYASLVVTTAGVVLGLIVLPSLGPLQEILALGTLLLGALLLLPFGLAKRLNREFRPLHDWLERRDPRSLLGRIHHFYHTLIADLEKAFVQDRATFARLLGINLLASLAGVVEIYLVLHALEPQTTLTTAIIVEAGSKLISLFAFFVPGNIGVREAGMVVLLQPFGLAASMGVTLALVRRARAIFWVGVGALLMFASGLRPAARPEANE